MWLCMDKQNHLVSLCIYWYKCYLVWRKKMAYFILQSILWICRGWKVCNGSSFSPGKEGNAENLPPKQGTVWQQCESCSAGSASEEPADSTSAEKHSPCYLWADQLWVLHLRPQFCFGCSWYWCSSQVILLVYRMLSCSLVNMHIMLNCKLGGTCYK